MEPVTDEPAPPPSEDDDNAVAVGLSMPMVACPGCGTESAAGACEECGTEVPEASIIRARQQAFAPLRQRVAELLEVPAEPAAPSLDLAMDQFATCVLDLEVDTAGDRFDDFFQRLARLNFDDPELVGGPVRRELEAYVDQLAESELRLAELMRFGSSGEGDELRTEAFRVGRWELEMLDLLLSILTASRSDAVDVSAVQTTIDASPLKGRFRELLDTLEDWARSDDNARVELMLGRPGAYTGEFGQLEPVAIMGAFADNELALEKIGQVVADYFEAALDSSHPERNNPVLLLPGIGLATLDRPLYGHRLLRLGHDLITRAAAVAPDAVSQILEMVVEQAPLVLAAMSRIQKSFRLLAPGLESGDVDDETAVASLLDSYRELVETAYRNLGASALRLEGLIRGEDLPAEVAPPMARELVDRLLASSEPALTEIGRLADVELRNAVAHSQYRWDAGERQVVDFRTTQVWSEGVLILTVDYLVAAVAGIDAAWSCFAAESEFAHTPSWVGDPVGREALQAPMAALLLSSRGFVVTDIRDQLATIVIEDPGPIEVAELTPALAGISELTAAERLTIATDDRALVVVDADVLQAAKDATGHMKPMALQEATFNTMVNTGTDPDRALFELVVMDAKVAAGTALQEMAEGDQGQALLALVDHIAYVRDRWQPIADQREMVKLADKLDRIEQTLALLASQPQALRQFLDQLVGLITWADKRGITWPPLVPSKP